MKKIKKLFILVLIILRSMLSEKKSQKAKQLYNMLYCAILKRGRNVK